MVVAATLIQQLLRLKTLRLQRLPEKLNQEIIDEVIKKKRR